MTETNKMTATGKIKDEKELTEFELMMKEHDEDFPNTARINQQQYEIRNRSN